MDIMTQKTNYDSEFCGNLAIHQTNSVQDYGYLLVIDRADFFVLQASENVLDFTGKPVHELIGTYFGDLISEQDLNIFQAEMNRGDRERVPFSFGLVNEKGVKPFYFLAHIKSDYIILEIEDATDNERSFGSVFQEVRSFISSIEQIDRLDDICQASIREIRRISGFDGIRMYQFDNDWNGTVIAEEVTGTLERYLGQTFPASDVPKQARALYIKNPFRLIPNRAYKPHRLYPVINSATHSFTDLSDCNLRSVASVHLEYMENMHVMASMSIRVMVKGQLWGLISCHHTTAKYVSLEHRSIFEWLSMEISYRISAVIVQEELNLSAHLLQKKSQIIENVLTQGDIVNGLMEDANQNLLSLFNATGFAISLNGRLFADGITPSQEEMENLIMWAEGKSNNKIYTSTALGEELDEAKEYTDKASGILIIPICANYRDFLVCFRPETVVDIKWGGDPNEAINFEKDGIRYHPRNSFRIWRQMLHGQSSPFSLQQLEIADLLRSFFFEFSSTQLLN